MQVQGQFSFEAGPREDGYARWVTGRKLAVEALARRVGLPIGHRVEVWLRGGIRLRGMLRLAVEQLFLDEEELRHMELMVDRTSFSYREIDSCLRLD